MSYNPEIHQRRSIRLRGYDYSQPGFYFVTVCTSGRSCSLGDVAEEQVCLSEVGELISVCWQDLPIHYQHIELDEFVVMPNHMHGIINIVDNRRGTASRAPTRREQFGRPVAGSLPSIIRSFKSASTRRINVMRHTPGNPIWQPNYYEHVIRTENELSQVRRYIQENPTKWSEDIYNPANVSTGNR